MIFDLGTPDTSVYMIAGYVIFFIITAFYLVSLFVRTRNLHRDIETLQTMETEAEPPAPEVRSAPVPRKAKASPAKRKSTKTSQKKAAQKR